MGADSVVALETGAAANPDCFKWSGRHNSILGRGGVPRAEIYRACARFILGGGSRGEARCVAHLPAEVAGGGGKFPALALEATLPALLREGALEALGGHFDSARNVSTLRKRGFDIPRK